MVRRAIWREELPDKRKIIKNSVIGN